MNSLSLRQKDTVKTLAKLNGYVNVDIDNMTGNDVNGMNSWSHEELPDYLNDLNQLSKSYQKIIKKHRLNLSSKMKLLHQTKEGRNITETLEQVEDDWRFLFIGVLSPKHVAHQLAYIKNELNKGEYE